MERRKETKKIDYVGDAINLLKPDGNGGWHNRGRTVKSLKALDSMIIGGEYNLEITDEVMNDLKVYRKKDQERREEYLRTHQKQFKQAN